MIANCVQVLQINHAIEWKRVARHSGILLLAKVASNGIQIIQIDGAIPRKCVALDRRESGVRDHQLTTVLQQRKLPKRQVCRGGAEKFIVNYSAFGYPMNAPLTRFSYTGQEFDADTGLYYYNARWYDPATGRFMSQDPLGFAAGDANLMRYVGNSATNATDPNGKSTIRPGDVLLPGAPGTEDGGGIDVSGGFNPEPPGFTPPEPDPLGGVAVTDPGEIQWPAIDWGQVDFSDPPLMDGFDVPVYVRTIDGWTWGGFFQQSLDSHRRVGTGGRWSGSVRRRRRLD